MNPEPAPVPQPSNYLCPRLETKFRGRDWAAPFSPYHGGRGNVRPRCFPSGQARRFGAQQQPTVAGVLRCEFRHFTVGSLPGRSSAQMQRDYSAPLTISSVKTAPRAPEPVPFIPIRMHRNWLNNIAIRMIQKKRHTRPHGPPENDLA